MARSDASQAHSAGIADAITYSHRVIREAQAVSERARAENSHLIAGLRMQRQVSMVVSSTPSELRETAKNFRIDNGLPVAELPALDEPAVLKSRKTRRVTPPSEVEEDFSLRQIMIHGD